METALILGLLQLSMKIPGLASDINALFTKAHVPPEDIAKARQTFAKDPQSYGTPGDVGSVEYGSPLDSLPGNLLSTDAIYRLQDGKFWIEAEGQPRANRPAGAQLVA